MGSNPVGVTKETVDTRVGCFIFKNLRDSNMKPQAKQVGWAIVSKVKTKTYKFFFNSRQNSLNCKYIKSLNGKNISVIKLKEIFYEQS